MSLRSRTGSVAVIALVTLAGTGALQSPQPAAAAVQRQVTAASVLDRLTEAQRVGQLFMVGGGANGVGSATVSAIRDRHVGSVILTGRSYAGTQAVRRITNGLQALATPAATGGVPLLVSADQEGGNVQVLNGPGFSDLPTALTQGSYPVSTLQGDARAWGSQLRSAGVNLDLAPVMDTVPPGTAQSNPPIGYYQREYGFDTATVAGHGSAFARGMISAGVAVTAKHFPGLGRVTGNTDTTAGVTDHVTTRHDAYLQPFAAAVAAGAQLVMVSTAYYSRIDPAHPAAFSPTVIDGMLRGDLGFSGVVVSDDLGDAAQVAYLSPGARAVDFIAAGGDLVLTVDPSVLPAMVDAVLTRAAHDAGFRARVDASALRVLTAKQRRGLVPRSHVPGDFDGDGRTDIAVYRPATGDWWIRGQAHVRYGVSGDIPLTGDFDGDGRTDIAVYRPSTGDWWIRGQAHVRYGESGDRPLPVS